MLKSVYCVDFTGLDCLALERHETITKQYRPTLSARKM